MTFLRDRHKIMTDTSIRGIPGNVLHRGAALDEIKTAGDLLAGMEARMGRDVEGG